MPFLSAMKMADYWAIEPPISHLYLRAHFQTEEQAPEPGMQPVLPEVPYASLPPTLQYAVRTMWLRRNPGKTEKDFLVEQNKKGMKKHGKKLEEARAKAKELTA